jgi:predicted dehydrogenase
MKQVLNAGLIGCGDYLRWEIDEINDSKYFKVKSTYDLDSEKSCKIAEQVDAQCVESADEIFDDEEISIVMVFTPPWAREELFRKAVEKGKHIISTKPFGTNLEDARKLQNIIQDSVNCSVFYGRTGNASVEQIKKILDSGEIGKLALYKEDWLHHYPVWNDWATDPEKNGGPFMDAMIHNLNKSRYLIDSPVKNIEFTSENYAQELKCNDTEFMKVDFESGASSWLFITWAADLEVFDPGGNDRVHYGLLHMITDEGWYITEEEKENRMYIKAVKEKAAEIWEVKPLEFTRYDTFSVSLQEGKKQPADYRDALRDMEIMEMVGR